MDHAEALLAQVVAAASIPSVREILSDPDYSLGVNANPNADLLENRTEQVPAMTIVGWLLIQHPLLDVGLDRRPCTRIRRSISRILTTGRPLNTFIRHALTRVRLPWTLMG